MSIALNLIVHHLFDSKPGSVNIMYFSFGLKVNVNDW